MKNILFCTLILLAACQERGDALLGKIEEIPLDTQESGNAFLSQSDLGHIYLSWLEYENESKVSLRLAQLNGSETGWENLGTVNGGNDWFVNWADFPSVVPLEKNRFIAHWLQYSGEGTYEYDIRYSLSNDNGRSWTEPVFLNDTTVNAEFGFVTIKKSGSEALAVWLDGRHMTGDHDETVHGEQGSMNLRAAYIDQEGRKHGEAELDDQVCDCCNTEVMLTEDGPLVAYRNKSDEGIRDVHIMRMKEGEWLKDMPLHQDGWHINGCPVNGPAADMEGKEGAIAWFTGAADSALVNLKLTHDGGQNFGPLVKVSDQGAIGRLDLVMHKAKDRVYVSWMQTKGKKASLKLAEYNLLGELINKYDIAEMSSARKSGFPKMVRSKKGIVFVYTDVNENGRQKIRTLHFY